MDAELCWKGNTYPLLIMPVVLELLLLLLLLLVLLVSLLTLGSLLTITALLLEPVLLELVPLAKLSGLDWPVIH